MKPFKPFQYRYEELKHGEEIYLKRWMIIFFGYSIRLHHWIKDDVGPHFHDHSCNFISFLFKGSYENITPADKHYGYFRKNIHYTYDKELDSLIQCKSMQAPAIWWVNGEAKHKLKISPEGAWTVLLCGRPYRKWGFWVNEHKWRPLRYFSKFKS